MKIIEIIMFYKRLDEIVNYCHDRENIAERFDKKICNKIYEITFGLGK
jgi:hypothetical protein